LALPKASADRSQRKDENSKELERIYGVSASILLRASTTNLPELNVSQLAATITEVWALAFSKEVPSSIP
jgi:hypothetical protein